MKNLVKKILFIIIAVVVCCNNIFAQADDIYKDMSLDELLNIDVVVTASKKPEDLFDAPLSVTIIKREQILKAGCRSIVEALRLSPGLIVRETTPGNFDVQIRGFDDVTKNLYVPLPFNTNILVMIDNRIVYSYYSGGTLWETLPIDINDVERVEIVRGPASALYGPNAVNGVINIITSHAKELGLNVFGNGSIGTYGSKHANVGVGYNTADKTKITFSANYSEQLRIDKNYYDWKEHKYVPYDKLSVMWGIVKDSATKALWSPQDYRVANNYNEKNFNLSIRKLGANIFFNHNFSPLSKIDISAGAQQSFCQIPYFINFSTPLSQVTSKSLYSDVRLQLNNLYCQVNASTGEYLSYKLNSYKYEIIDANVEYALQWGDFSFRPGIAHKETRYYNPITEDNTTNIADISAGFSNTPQRLASDALSILSEWKPNSKLRFIGGIRVDKFNVNPNVFPGSELGTTYRLNKNNLFRATFSNAKRSPFIFDSYLNARINVLFPIPLSYNKSAVNVDDDQHFNATKTGNNYPTNTTLELGWRSKLTPNLTFDIEIFTSKIKNLLVSVMYRDIHVVTAINQDYSVDSIESIKGVGSLYFQNNNVSAIQNGITASINYSPINNLNIKLFGSLQKTNMLGNINVKYTTTDSTVDLSNLANHKITVSTNSHVNMTSFNPKTMPAFYGGLIIDYNLNDKLKVNLNSYYTSKQVFTGLSFENALADYSGINGNYSTEIPAWLVVNARMSYNLWSRASAYISGLNLLGKHREFGFTDQIGSTFMVGFQWGF